MIRALAIKELRESAGLAVLGVLCAIGIVGPLMGITVVPMGGSMRSWYPFVNELHLSSQALALGFFAFLLGLKQTAWEIHQGTFQFLFHRPMPRHLVFAVKLVIGAVIVLVINAFMIGLFGWWSATPGNHASPFFWSMALPSWKLGVSLLLVYLGAFLSGVRQARWFGTRLVPMAFSIACVYTTYLSPWWWSSLATGISSAAVLLTAIFYFIRISDQ